MFSYVCAAIASFHNAQAVLIAAGITALVAFSVSLFAIQTKIDFTMCYGLIFAASMVLLLMGIAFIIIYAVIPPGVDGKNHYVSAHLLYNCTIVAPTQSCTVGVTMWTVLDHLDGPFMYWT